MSTVYPRHLSNISTVYPLPPSDISTVYSVSIWLTSQLPTIYLCLRLIDISALFASPITSISTLWLWSFLLTSHWHGEIFYIPWPGTEFFHSYRLPWTCLVLEFCRLWFAVPPLSKVQGKFLYNNFISGEPATQFPSVCTKQSIDKHYFSSFQGW